MQSEQWHFTIYCAEPERNIITETVKSFPQALYIVSVKCCNIPNDHKMEQVYKKKVFCNKIGKLLYLAILQHKRYQM